MNSFRITANNGEREKEVAKMVDHLHSPSFATDVINVRVYPVSTIQKMNTNISMGDLKM